LIIISKMLFVLKVQPARLDRSACGIASSLSTQFFGRGLKTDFIQTNSQTDKQTDEFSDYAPLVIGEHLLSLLQRVGL